jgi:hypothetical protein
MIEHEKLRLRLRELERESRTGLDRLAALEQERHDVRNTLLRIDGAMRVLRELLPQSAEPRAALGSSELGNDAE